MSEFKKFRRKQIAELRPVTDYDIDIFYARGNKLIISEDIRVSISDEDIKAGSPKIGDMVARNPKNHNDQWLVAEQYFRDNFEPISGVHDLEKFYED
jgi:hypothetical protein